MSDPLRPTAHTVELIDALVDPPPHGAKVFALGIGGVMTQVVWNKHVAEHFVAWMPYPKVPASVKERLAQRWAPAVNGVNPERK